MFDYVRCCRCREAVRLPDSFANWVQCPHCNSEYPLDKILDQLPPPLRVVAPPRVAELSKDDDTTSEHADTLSAEAAGGERAGTSLISKPPPTVVIDDSLPKSRVRSPEGLRAERKKTISRRTSRHDGGMLKIILGGFAGLCLGQLILWWLPSPYRTDPAKLAPKLPSSVAFLAPASLRGIETVTLLPNTSERTATPGAPLDGRASLDAGAPNSSLDEVPPSPVRDAEPPLVEPPKSNRPQEIMIGADAPTFSIKQLQEALTRARAADQEYSSAATAAADLSGWHDPMSELAHHVTYADTSEPDIQKFATEAKRFLRKLALDQRKRKSLGELAFARLTKAEHDRKGVLVPGRVESIVRTTHYFETKLALPHELGSAVVLSRVDPGKAYKQGNIVLILGVVVAEPSLYVPGYGGAENAIVFGGLPVRLK